jgi:hypothetical protein
MRNAYTISVGKPEGNVFREMWAKREGQYGNEA